MKVFPDTVFSISKNYCTRGFLVIKLLPYFIVFQANFLHFLTSLKESHIIQLRACHSFNDSISPLTGHKIMMLLTFKGILVLMIHIGNYTLQTLLGQYFYWDSISFDWLLPIIKGYMSHLPLNKDLNTVITSTVNLESGLNKLFMPCLSTYKKWLQCTHIFHKLLNKIFQNLSSKQYFFFQKTLIQSLNYWTSDENQFVEYPISFILNYHLYPNYAENIKDRHVSERPDSETSYFQR